MKYRIAMWASTGFLVAGFWALYLFPASPIPVTLTQQIVWILSRLTCPVALASTYFHFGVSIYWALLANAATYALIGAIGETLQHQLQHAKQSR